MIRSGGDPTIASGPARIEGIDVVRGFAVCGILVMNVVAMGLPGYAYVAPDYDGNATGLDLFAWGVAYVVADGKMRALFTMLFGASLLIVTDAAEHRVPGPARTHYPRMLWLLAFGMLHAWLVWYGDILVEYAIVGALAFVARRWPPSALAYAALLLIGWEAAHHLILWHDLTALHTLATGPNPPPDAVATWDAVRTQTMPDPATIATEVRLYRGGLADAFAARAPVTALFQFTFLPGWIPGGLGFCLLGMLLHRLDFWSGGWSAAGYRRMLLAGLVGLAATAALVPAILARRFDPAFLPLTDFASLLARPWIALGYAAALILLVRAGRARPLVTRLAAAGQMALSNYLGTSLVVTTLFYGYGLGLFCQLSRAQLYPVVLLVWLLILGWSRPWLARYRYGPLEWLWRSLARGTLQPMRKSSIAN